MGTKTNPGQFDCHAKALPDEPVFTLIGRDPMAHLLVRLWAALRRHAGEAEAVVAEAEQCADAMRDYCQAQGKTPHPNANFIYANRPDDLEHWDGGRSSAALFHFLDEASSMDDAKAVALLHGYRLTWRLAELPDDLQEAHDRGEDVIARWNPEPPFAGAIFAGKIDLEDGDLISKWLVRLDWNERERWSRIFAQVINNPVLADLALTMQDLRSGGHLDPASQPTPPLVLLDCAAKLAKLALDRAAETP